MSIDRRALLSRYLATEGAIPITAKVPVQDVGWHQGWGAISLPSPFQGALVTGGGLTGEYKAWLIDPRAPGHRVVLIHPKGNRSPDDALVVMTNRGFTTLTRRYWKEGDGR